MQTLMAANRMFILLATMITQPSNCLIASMDDLSDLWHHRYGHVNNKINVATQSSISSTNFLGDFHNNTVLNGINVKYYI